MTFQKYVSMIWKCHNNTLQTSPRNRGEVPNSVNSNKASVRQLKQSNQLSFAVTMIAQLERAQSNVYQNKDQTQIPHKQWELSQNNNSTTSEPPP